MQRIRRADFALLLISEDYLKSKNCLFEVGQLLKEEDVWKKILPVTVGRTNIYDLGGRISYVKYWQDQENKLSEILQGVDIINALPSYNDLKIIRTYSGFIDEFLSKIVDMFHIDHQELIDKQYKPLFDKIGVMDVTYLIELLAISKIENLKVKDIALEEYQGRFGVNTYFYCMKGKLESDLGRIDKARYYYMKSLELDPLNTETMNNLGFLYNYAFKNLPEAQKLYEQALSLNPDLVVTLLNLGVLYRKTEKVDLAIKQFEHVIKIESSNYKAYQNLANIYSIERLDVDKAEKLYKKALKYNPTHIESLMGYANILKLHRKEIDKGNKLYKKAKLYDKTGHFTPYIDALLKTHKG
jgi:tetratricopeptide (TPR) repeat protein